MKLTFIVLISALLHISTTGYGYAQKVTIKAGNASITQIFDRVREQTGYDFLYNAAVLKNARPVSLDVKDQPLKAVLDACFANQPFTYSIDNKTILVRPRASSGTQAQEVIRVTGRVTNESREALPGVSIMLKGNASTGTVTDLDGKYAISVADTATLVFSYTGYGSREVKVDGRSQIDIVLSSQESALDEVVVIGYGTVKKGDLTGSVAQVKAAEINAFPTSNALQALSGRAPGVQVAAASGAPGPTMAVRIRGGNSLQGSNEPLYVVDGFPLTGNNPTILNNADIESMEILKDASATAIYGSRGANGVIIITTKRGTAGATKVDVDLSYGVQQLRKRLDLMNAKEFATFYNMQAANDNVNPYFTQEQIDALGTGFDWQDFVFQSAPMRNTSVNVSGGNDKTQFSASGSVFGQEGIIKGSDYNRYSLRTNVTHKINDKFKVNANATLSRLKTDRRDNGGGSRGNSMISAAISASPALTPYNEDGSYRNIATAYPFVAPDIINPINWINEQTNSIKANLVLANAALIYNPIPEITVKISGGIENRDDRTDNYTTNKFQNSPGRAEVITNQQTSLLSENTISYDKTFGGRHNFSALAGFTYQDFTSTYLNGSGVGFLSNASESYDLSAANIPGIPGSGYQKSALMSYLGRINYSLDDKYLLTASFRADGSSRYSDGDKWGFFPSAAVAWKISNEDFMKDADLISDLKLRTSWGLTGSQAIDPYSTLNQLGSGKTVFGETLYTSYAPGTRLPANLKWESTEQIDIGLNVGILQNRFYLTADYYIKNTRDLLNTVSLPASMGYTTTIQNVGQVQNKGFELGLSANIFSKAFQWDVQGNMSFNRNKVVKLYNGEDILGSFLGINIVSDNRTILREGQPVGTFYGFVEDGYQDNGQIRYKDLDGDGQITINDKTYIGNPNPDFVYGFTSNMRYKNFEFSFFLQGTYGNDLFNASAIGNTIDYGAGLNMLKEVLYDHWTPEKTNAKYPRISRSTSANVSDRWIEDGSFLRLRDIRLAYNIPLRGWIRNAQVYVSGQNLLTFTKYSWWDPELGFSGTDFLSYPVAKTVTFGIRAGF